MSIDPTDAIADARDGLDRAAGPFVRAQSRLGVATGKDATGEVLVRVQPDGRLDDVVLGTAWSTHIEPDAIGAAVMSAYTDATTASLNQWGETVAEEADHPQLRPMPDVSTSLHARLDEITDPSTVAGNSELVLGRLADMLAEVNAELDQVTEEAETVAAAVSTGTVRDVTVSVNGLGALVDVHVEPQRATRGSAAGLAQDLLKAYRAAARQAGTRTVDDVIAGSRIGEVQRLAADPHAFAQRFGLV